MIQPRVHAMVFARRPTRWVSNAVAIGAMAIGSLLITPGVFAVTADPLATPPTPVALTQLQTAYGKIHGLSAAFVQQTRFAGFSKTRRFAGTLELMRPDQMRWDYAEGSRQQIYVSGNEVTLYAPSSEQAIVSHLDPASDRQVPLHLLADVSGIESTYAVAVGSDGELVLTPHETLSGAPERIHLWLDPATHLIARVRLLMPGGNTSDITFSALTLDPVVAQERFRFVPPDGVYVVHPDTLFPTSKTGR